jgi:hypothetical protein
MDGYGEINWMARDVRKQHVRHGEINWTVALDWHEGIAIKRKGEGALLAARGRSEMCGDGRRLGLRSSGGERGRSE